MNVVGRERLRVLHCIHSLSGGGAERQLKILADGSRNSGMDAAICCVNDDGNDIKDRGVRIYRSKRANKYNFSVFPSIASAVEDFKPHVIHAWLPEVVTIPTMILACINRIPCVFSYRGAMYFRRALSVIEYFLVLTVAAGIASNHDVSSSSSSYKRLFKAKKGVIIRNAVCVHEKYVKTERDFLRHRSCTILYVGRITAVKNWRCLLHAFALINGCSNMRLAICGTGDEEGEIDVIASKLGISDRLDKLGYRTDIYNIMQSADILVLPSWSEGTPNVLLEAFQIGLPCIVSDIPAHKDIIGETRSALIFNPSRPDELAQRIVDLCGSAAHMRELANNARGIVASYTSEKMVEDYYKLYLKVARIKPQV